MADLDTIRARLASNCEAITGVQWSQYIMANPTPPCGMVGLFRIPDSDTTYQRGIQEIEVTLRVLVSTASTKAGQIQLDRFILGPESVKNNLESDKTLGGAVDDLHVSSMESAQFIQEGRNQAFLGGEWTVRLLVPDPDS